MGKKELDELREKIRKENIVNNELDIQLRRKQVLVQLTGQIAGGVQGSAVHVTALEVVDAAEKILEEIEHRHGADW